MKHISSLIFSLMLLTAAHAQPPARIQELSIGDQLPDIVLNNLSNYPKESARLSELQQGKLMIIEFWASYCGTCLGFAPKIDSLQQQFKNDLQVLQVTSEPQKTIEAARQKVAVLKASNLPVVTGDTLLKKYFPYHSVPHNIWVNDEGKVIAITSHEDVTASNIRTLLAKQAVAVRIKKDNMTFDTRKPYSPADSLLRYRTVLSGFNSGIGGGATTTPGNYFADSVSRIFMWNTTALNLLYTAFMQGVCKSNLKRIDLHVKDSFRLMYPGERLAATGFPDQRSWKESNLYCYDLLANPCLPKNEFYAAMMDDLARSFKVRAEVKIRKVPTWVISKTKERKGSPVSPAFVKKEEESSGMDMKISTLVYYLNLSPGTEPFVDETGIANEVHFSGVVLFNPDEPVNISALQKIIGEQGLKVQLEMRRQPVLVIADR